jgi:hypothetical protein
MDLADATPRRFERLVYQLDQASVVSLGQRLDGDTDGVQRRSPYLRVRVIA